LCKDADNYSSTYEELHTKLFAEQKDGIRLIWEYVNMMYLDYDGDEFLQNYKADFENFKKLSEFYKKFGTLPLAEGRTIISIFRFYLGLDNYFEEVNNIELQHILRKEKDQEQEQQQKMPATTTEAWN